MERLTNAPFKLGLLGDKRVFKSPSPAMHQAALRSLGLEGSYIPIEAQSANLENLLKELWEKGFAGLNVTAPLKEAVKPYLASLTNEALATSAVNTLIYSKGGYIGSNTDAQGFSDAYLTRGFERSLIIGAGGAARAVCQAFRSKGLSVALTCRRSNAGKRLAEEFSFPFVEVEQLPQEPCFDLIVNATSASSPSELGEFLPRPGTGANAVVIDINYSRPLNYWKDLAVKAKAHFSDGLPMLAHQARLSFILWTGSDPTLEPFLTTLDNWVATPIDG
ncbi:MAG: shikimate dehydrogenase [Deltaproteobacteria bacterium]|jgi:shikimate dehydrogenase|nr:shikimate dehydrogenase [Deltaproteobacteria bacterium]